MKTFKQMLENAMDDTVKADKQRQQDAKDTNKAIGNKPPPKQTAPAKHSFKTPPRNPNDAPLPRKHLSRPHISRPKP